MVRLAPGDSELTGNKLGHAVHLERLSVPSAPGRPPGHGMGDPSQFHMLW